MSFGKLLIFFCAAQREETSKLFRSFRNAWDLVRHQLSSQGSISLMKIPIARVDDEISYFCLVSIHFSWLWECIHRDVKKVMTHCA